MLASFHTPWSPAQEDTVKSYSEKATIFKLLHYAAYDFYRFRYACFAVPIIIITTIGGMLAFLASTYPEYNFILVTGILNVIAAMMGAISQFFKLAEMMEGHRVAQIQWGEFARELTLVLTQERLLRPNVTDFLERMRKDMNRLSEISPLIPTTIVNQKKVEWLDEFPENFALPDILGYVQEINIVRPTVETTDQSIQVPAQRPRSESVQLPRPAFRT